MKLLIAILALTAGTGALAAGKEDHPCAADRAKFCKDVKPGGGKLAKCMKEHDAELSSACKSHAEEAKDKFRDKMKAAREACEADREKFCKDVQPGGGAIVKCLKSHDAELAAACKASLPKRGPKK